MRDTMRLRALLVLLYAALLCCIPAACQTGAEGSGRSIDDCSLACWRISNANCGDIGEECFDQCVRMDPVRTECAVEQQQYTDCFWKTEAYRCDPDFGTLPTTCDSERNAARTCLGLGDASPDDASTVDATLVDDAAAASDASNDQ
jgi:hypothetical protein